MTVAITATTATAAITSKIPSNRHFQSHFTLTTIKPFKPLKLKPKHHHSHTLSFSLLHASLTDPIIRTVPFSDTQEEEEEGFEENNDDYDDEEEEQDESESECGEVGRLYVGNLPYAMASAQLSELFVEAGRVVSVEIVYDRVTDRSRGFAFVTMGSIKEAKEAIRMYDGSQIGGRTVKVNFPEVPRGREREVMGPKIRSSNESFVDSPHKIYAGNLGWSLTSQGLKDAFSDQPGLLSAKVVYDRATGRSRGFGFITFSSSEAAQSALTTMNGVELGGRPLRLNKAEQRAPTSQRPHEDPGNIF